MRRGRIILVVAHLYQVSRTQFGFAPIDSVRIALAAAEAARTFQPTQSRQAANAALPALVTHDRLLAQAAPAAFNLEEAARLELDWWQARREAVGARDYGLTIAKVAALTYGKGPDDPALQQSRRAGRTDGRAGLGREQAAIVAAYRLLKAAVAD